MLSTVSSAFDTFVLVVEFSLDVLDESLDMAHYLVCLLMGIPLAENRITHDCERNVVPETEHPTRTEHTPVPKKKKPPSMKQEFLMMLDKRRNKIVVLRAFQRWQMTMFCATQHALGAEGAFHSAKQRQEAEHGGERESQDSEQPCCEEAKDGTTATRHSFNHVHNLDLRGWAEEADANLACASPRRDLEISPKGSPLTCAHAHGDYNIEPTCELDGGHGQPEPRQQHDGGLKAIEVSNPAPTAGDVLG
mmetsp:Transcript_44074/g.88363  ORF Transcript_44074/g.88363 Transcript_44074/m.88363 type:complete len:249 (-) Transcript_44074:196-942(-)